MVDVDELAAAVRAHPAVARLDGGPFGTVASFLPGRRRVDGVRIGVGAEPVELAVIARWGCPLPQLAAELGAIVRGLCGPVAVDVTFCDVVVDDRHGAATEPRPRWPGGRRRPAALA